MKNNFRYINYLMAMAILVFLVSCGQKDSSSEDHGKMKMDSTPDHDSVMVYSCPMHPEVISDKPGTCPKCGMDLEHMKVKNETDTLSYLIQPTDHVILSALKPIVPSSDKQVNKIEASGYLTYNPDYASSISARVDGRIEKLYVRYNFQLVNKGEKLLDLYSPELLTAQNEYLYVINSNSPDDNVSKESLKTRLINLGMTEGALFQLEKTRKVNPYVSVYASNSGHVHFLSENTDMSAHALTWPGNTSGSAMGSNTASPVSEMLKEGDYVKKGDPLFIIADESGIWALFKIKPADIPYIQIGDEVDIVINEVAHPGKVNFVEKSFDPKDDFYTVRIYLTCDNHSDLQIGTLVRGVITTQSKNTETIWVPTESILDLGKSKSVVFIKMGFVYKAKEVRTGIYANRWVEVTSGLSLTDSIAPVASYLVDSEAFIVTEEK